MGSLFGDVPVFVCLAGRWDESDSVSSPSDVARWRLRFDADDLAMVVVCWLMLVVV